MELELKHIKSYQIGGDKSLKVQFADPNYKKHHDKNISVIGRLVGINVWDKSKSIFASIEADNGCRYGLSLNEIKPLLIPMSSLYTEITHNGNTFIPWKELDWGSWNDEIGYIVSAEYGENPRVAINVLDFIDDYYKLLEWHFDVFGLIDKGLALDKTKIK